MTASTKRVGLTCLITLLMLAAPAAATSPHVGPSTAARSTVVYGEGHAGLLLSIPDDTELRTNDFNVQLLDDATYAFVGLADPAPDSCGRQIDPLFGMCLTHKLFQTNMPYGSEKHIKDPPTVPAGPQELYIVSDGPVRVSMVFTGLDGSTELEADGSIHAISEWIARRCPTAPDCNNLAYGGATHVAQHPGFVAVFAHSWTPDGRVVADIPYPASQAGTGCLYPGYGSGSASTDPADYPQGCRFLPTQEGDWAEHLSRIVLSSSNGVGGARTVVQSNVHPDGPVYAGFMAQQRSTGGPGGFGAFGIWLEEGIH